MLLTKNNNWIKINSYHQFGICLLLGRWKQVTFKTLIFENFWGPEVVGSSSYWRGIYSFILAFIVLQDRCESPRPWPLYHTYHKRLCCCLIFSWMVLWKQWLTRCFQQYREFQKCLETLHILLFPKFFQNFLLLVGQDIQNQYIPP